MLLESLPKVNTKQRKSACINMNKHCPQRRRNVFNLQIYKRFKN